MLLTNAVRFVGCASTCEFPTEILSIRLRCHAALSKVGDGGTRSCRAYSGAGALRADITVHWEMDDASVYERALLDSDLRGMLGRLYGQWDLKTAGQAFRREITPEMIKALSSTE